MAGWDWIRTASLVGLSVAVAIGVWARLNGLGFSSLAADEYYFVQSIRRIVATGLPAFESGGYYVRGVLVQYLTVPSMWLAASEEMGVRLPSVAFGLAAALAAYLYGRRTIGRPWAIALAAMLLLSSWEIEFSRFGRMYAGFQFVTLAFLVSLYDVIGGTNGFRRYLPILLCLMAVGTHALALFLLPLLFLPVLLPGRVKRLGGKNPVIRYSVAAGLPATVAVAQRLIDFRRMGVQNALPADFVAGGGSLITFPTFPFWSFGSPAASLAAFVMLLGLVGVGCYLLVRSRRIDESAAIAAICLVCAVGHFLLLAGLLGLLLVFRYGLPRTAREHAAGFKLGAAAAVVALGWVAYASWLTYGLGSREWIETAGVHLFSEAALSTFIWPDPSLSVAAGWFLELPRLAWLFVAALIFQLLSRARDPISDLVRNPATFVGYLILVLALFTPAIVTTRYMYFAYPVALAMLVLSVRDAAKFAVRRSSRTQLHVLVGVPVSLALFAIGGDFHPGHLIHVDSYDSTYRTGEFQAYGPTWYERDDDVATATYVVGASSPQDVVIVVETPAISHYLSREHSLYLDRRGSRFVNVSRLRGTLDLWSNRPLLGTAQEVNEITRCTGGTVWIVRSLAERRWLDPTEIWGEQLGHVETVFVNPDASQEVLRVSLQPGMACPGVAND